LSYPKSDNLPVEFLNEYMSFKGERGKDFINDNYNNKFYSFREMISRFGFLSTLKIIIKMKILN